MRTIVAGGRRVLETEPNVRLAVRALLDIGATEVISGCAHGADACGEMAAARLGLVVRLKPADWKRLGKAAGPIRNKAMAAIADACILFPGDAGTEDMRSQAEARGLTIVYVQGAAMQAPKVKRKMDHWSQMGAE